MEKYKHRDRGGSRHTVNATTMKHSDTIVNLEKWLGNEITFIKLGKGEINFSSSMNKFIIKNIRLILI